MFQYQMSQRFEVWVFMLVCISCALSFDYKAEKAGKKYYQWQHMWPLLITYFIGYADDGMPFVVEHNTTDALKPLNKLEKISKNGF